MLDYMTSDVTNKCDKDTTVDWLFVPLLPEMLQSHRS